MPARIPSHDNPKLPEVSWKANDSQLKPLVYITTTPKGKVADNWLLPTQSVIEYIIRNIMMTYVYITTKRDLTICEIA